MMYRNFAIGVLLAAPIIVMGVQSITPKPQITTPAANSASTPEPVPVPVAPPIAPAAPSAVSTADFGQPIAGAGQPMLAPGTGLPETSAAPMVDTTPAFTANGAPVGSPNAEK
ncbi:hypothetical protein [Sphingobium sp. CAP-1]|uniref:hypothetical protein n=1 Tax=Sphingobium sp. CAP-1 TaxID=2676077 RepID=UPI0012BB2C57|nr:hypothetical protein [Sphingobium sp. CAP-1]QGP78872.1 hypothetical protein GL174_07615 [Sphingobium sp. CAP-1]